VLSNHSPITSSFIISHIFIQSFQSLSIPFQNSRVVHSDLIFPSAVAILSQNYHASDTDLSNVVQKTNTIPTTHSLLPSKEIDQSTNTTHSSGFVLSNDLIVSSDIFFQSFESFSILFENSRRFHSDCIVLPAIGTPSQKWPDSDIGMPNTAQNANPLAPSHLLARSILVHQSAFLQSPNQFAQALTFMRSGVHQSSEIFLDSQTPAISKGPTLSRRHDETVIQDSEPALYSNDIDVTNTMEHSTYATTHRAALSNQIDASPNPSHSSLLTVSNHPAIGPSPVISHIFTHSFQSLSIAFQHSMATHSDSIIPSAVGVLPQDFCASDTGISILILQSPRLPFLQTDNFALQSQLDPSQSGDLSGCLRQPDNPLYSVTVIPTNAATAEESDSTQVNQTPAIAATTVFVLFAIALALLILLLKRYHRHEQSEDPMAYEIDGKVADLAEEGAQELENDELYIREFGRGFAADSFHTEEQTIQDETFVSACDELF
jgi:hypothetical protein